MVRGLWRRTTGVALLAVAVLMGSSVQAADNSLQLVPADAGFYSAMLRNKEQVDRLINSKAFQAVWNLPQVQTGWKKFQEEYNKESGDLARFRQVLQSPRGQEVVAVLTEAVSDEIFLYGSDAIGDTLKLAMTVGNGLQFGPLKALLQGQAGGLDPEKLQTYFILKALADNLNLIKVPDLVIGFKIKNTERAEKLLAQLETLIQEQALKNAPAPIKGRFKRTQVGKSSLLTVNLDGSLVPWDRVPISDLEQKEGEFAGLVQKLRQLTLTVTLGLHEGFLVVGIGPSTEPIAKLSAGGPLLKDRPEFKTLSKAGDNKLTDINYTSKSFLTKITSGNVEQFDQMLTLARDGLKASPLPEERQAAILKDLENLVKDLKAMQPTYGAALAFNFATARGTEGYAHDWTKYPTLPTPAAVKPLTMLSHLGGDPILAVVGRGKVDVEQYRALAKYVRAAYGHATALIRPNITDEEKQKRFDEVTKAIEALAKKCDDITANLLYPATADGQLGFVLDAKWTSKEWVAGVPFEKAMPMVEIGLLLGLSDSEAFVKALTGYRKLVNEAISEFGRLVPEANVPPALEIPPTTKKEVGKDTLYYYPLGNVGLDRRFQPMLGVARDAAVIVFSEDHATRLLASKPLKLEGGPLASRLDKPLLGAFFCDTSALLDAVAPWAELGISQAMKGADADEKTIQDGLKAYQTVLQLLRCVKQTSGATYFEDDAIVTHSETVVKDID